MLTDAALALMAPEARAVAIAEEVARVADDYSYWWRTYVKIKDATGEATIPWQWWPVHDEIEESLQERRLVVLKARQISWSWTLASYALHGAQFRQNYNVLELSRGQLEASKLLEKSAFIWREQPDWLRPSTTANNSTTLAFATSGGSITALPATEDAGRSETASLVVVDEAAFHPYAASNYAAYKPAVDAGGQLIIVSTANGVGNWFHRMYQDAKAGINGFTARFWPWSVRPGRDAAWYEQQRQEYAADPGKLEQEYPSSDAEAFLLSGGGRFNRDALRHHLEVALQRTPLPRSLWPASLREVEGLTIWVLPQPGIPYVAGSDVAEGLIDGDFDCTIFLNARTLEHVATLHGTWEPAYFAELTAKVCHAYNKAYWGIERNNHGHTAIHVAYAELKYSNLYWHEEDEASQSQKALYGKQEKTRRLGWPTTGATKPPLIDGFAGVLASFAFTTYDPELLGECQTFVRLPNGSTKADKQCHDDRVMAAAIARRMALQPGAQSIAAAEMPAARRYGMGRG